MALSSAVAIVDLAILSLRAAGCVIGVAAADVDAVTATAIAPVTVSVTVTVTVIAADADHWKRQRKQWHMPALIVVVLGADRRNSFAGAAGDAIAVPAWSSLRADY